MYNVIQAENLKYKRSFAKKLVFIAPFFFVLFAGYILLKIPAGQKMSWNHFPVLVFNWWPLIFIPLGTALLCSLSEMRERKAGNYRNFRTHDINPFLLWGGKTAVLAFYLLLSSVTVIFITLPSTVISGQGVAASGRIIAASLLIWLVSLSLIPIQLFAAAWKGTVVSMGLGFVGMITGVLMAPSSLWLVNPWSWALRLMCPVIGVHPNGVTLTAGDPLLDFSVIPVGIAVSLLFFVISILLTGFWFSKREVR